MQHSARTIAFIAGLGMLTGALPARAADPAPAVSWLGVTIAAPVATLRQTLGDPLLVTTNTDSPPAYREARYAIDGTHAFLILTERYGRVRSIRATLYSAPDAPLAMPPDPSGIVLGETAEQIVAKHPNARRQVDGDWVSIYEAVAGQRNLGVRYKFFLTGRLQTIDYFLADPDAKATPPPDALPALVEPAGDAYETAVIDGAKHETSGVDWEYLYLNLHACAPNQHWKTKQQSLQNHAGRVYDVLHVVCPSSNAERDYFFDITSYFGKP